MTDQDIKAWFLGAKAENQETFERFLLDAFRDYCYWRRNFHPEDRAGVQATDRLSPQFLAYQERLRDQLFEMLSQLKRSMPFFSPRYLGHMAKDLLTPGLLGYIAAMFYNQNNITRESATITTAFEVESMQGLARMLGYDPNRAWGHFCSGGTVANIEALWTARNVRLFPYQVALARDSAPSVWLRYLDQGLENTLEHFVPAQMTVSESLRLYAHLTPFLQQDKAFKQWFESFSVGDLGLMGFYQACAKGLAAAPPQFKVAYSQNAHYSLKKSLELLGIGHSAAWKIPLDEALRLDVQVLASQLAHKGEHEQLLAVVGVYGSTEEGAIDDFDALTRLRQQTPGGFWLHGDACYGGYAMSLEAEDTTNADTLLRGFLQAQTHEPETIWSALQCQRWHRVSQALSQCDSMALDPHKLGYLPYPSGTVLYRDFSSRHFIHCDAPYLNAGAENTDNYWDTAHPGYYTLEGSRPGATSAAVWLAQRTVPLTRQGHGMIVANTLAGTAYLKKILTETFSQYAPGLHCRFLVENPDLNVLCYTFVGQKNGQTLSLRQINRQLELLYQELLAQNALTQDFVVSMTRLRIETYGEAALNTYWQRLSAGRATGRVRLESTSEGPDDDQLVLLRTVVMDPFLHQASTRQGSQERPIAEVFAEVLAQCFYRHTLLRGQDAR